jgi:hypothetical protein
VIGEKVSARDFALDNNGMAGTFPSDGVGHFATHACLLGKNNATAITAEPFDGQVNQLRVSHDFPL